ncbi:MAG TPA: hypothetical protein VMK83_04345 [Gaiellaceae bacterium]|nr:hypothetical protein [Gaiellaceae bacterium]
MRNLVLALCALAMLVGSASVAGAAEPNVGTLSVERAKGVVMVDLRGSLLGRLGNGSLRVTDHTPNDRYSALVVGRRVTQERLGPRTVLYRGLGLRFRMLGGGYRVVMRGSGISVSAVGRGTVMLVAEPRVAGDDAGVYSLDGVDCSLDPDLCTPLPVVAERFVLEPPPTERPRPRSAG